MGKIVFLTLSVAAVSAVIALTFTGLESPPTTAQGPTTLGVDADPSGNEATSLGSIEACRTVSSGSSFDLDIYIKDVNDLRTWELTFQYDPALIRVTGAEEMFLGANPGSNIFEISEPLPDTDGLYVVGASDASDATDTGSGVLVRLTLEASGTGISSAGLPQIDVNNDGQIDLGPLLDDAAGNDIGDVNGDGFFDGPTYHAQIAVDTSCPDTTPTPTLPTPLPGETPTPVQTPPPEETPPPDQTPTPGQTPTPTPPPDQTPAPGQTPTPTPPPDQTPAPGQTPTPTPAPGQTPTLTPPPDQTPAPGQSPAPGQTLAPGQTPGVIMPGQTPGPGTPAFGLPNGGGSPLSIDGNDWPWILGGSMLLLLAAGLISWRATRSRLDS